MRISPLAAILALVVLSAFGVSAQTTENGGLDPAEVDPNHSNVHRQGTRISAGAEHVLI